MAKSNHVKSAQKNIYKIGKRVEYVSEKGKREGQTLSKLDRTIPADENDEIFIAKGEGYYWWQFKNSAKQFSKTAPKQSQLTQSNFLSQLYALEEKIVEFSVEDCEDKAAFEAFRDEVKDEIEALRDECQDSLDAMPEQLQDSSINNERIDAMESWASDIENVECDYDEDELKDEVKDEMRDNEEIGEDEEPDFEDEDVKEKLQEKIREKVEEAIEELQNQSHEL